MPLRLEAFRLLLRLEAISNRVGPQTHHGEGVFSAFLKGPDGQLLEVESLWPELLCEVPRVPAAGPTPFA